MTLTFVPIDPIEAFLFRLAFFRRKALMVRTDFEADLAEWYGLTAGQARMVSTLHMHGPLPREALITAASMSLNSLSPYLGQVRQAMGENSIIAVRDGNEPAVYHLTQAGRAACDEAVEHVGLGRLRRELAA